MYCLAVDVIFLDDLAISKSHPALLYEASIEFHESLKLSHGDSEIANTYLGVMVELYGIPRDANGSYLDVSDGGAVGRHFFRGYVVYFEYVYLQVLLHLLLLLNCILSFCLLTDIGVQTVDEVVL